MQKKRSASELHLKAQKLTITHSFRIQAKIEGNGHNRIKTSLRIAINSLPLVILAPPVSPAESSTYQRLWQARDGAPSPCVVRMFFGRGRLCCKG
jgi:hypothetical protein